MKSLFAEATVLVALLAVSSASKESCCTKLSGVLPGQAAFPGLPDYTSTEQSYWSLQESALAPTCIVKPQTAQDVAKAISIILETKGCKFAIKGQGHAPAAGFANIDGGVTIDMTYINLTTLNTDHSIVSIGAGARWLDVYRYLDSFNISVAGGRNGLVGVGGLMLGGGISHFTTRVGWACDNVVNFEVVLADGSITNANSTFHQDLYRALKGGGSNFGIVTRFDLSTFPQGEFSVTSIVHDISHREAVFQAFTNIADSPHFDVNTSLVQSLIYNSTSKAWIISSSAVYTAPVLKPAVFPELESIPALSNKSSLTRLADYADEKPTPPLNWLFATLTFKPSADLMLDIFSALNKTLSDLNPAGGVVWNIACEPLPSVISSHAASNGGNVLGLSPTDGNSFIMLFSALWPNSTSNAEVERTAKKVLQNIEAHAKAKGLLQRFQYMNYAAPYQDPIASYGAQSVEFLRKTSATYDANRTFEEKVPGGFKLPHEN